MTATNIVDQVRREVENRSPRWLGVSGPVHVIMGEVDQRRQSTLIRMRVEAADVSGSLIVKLPKAVPADPHLENRLVRPVSDPVTKSRLEFDALTVMARHFGALDDPRFGWAKVYDHLTDMGAIVIEQLPPPTFHELLRRGPTRRVDQDPISVMRNLGGWLTEYHQLTTPEATVRDSAATEVIEGIRKLTEIVSTEPGHPTHGPELDDVIRMRLPRILPTEFPIGLGHGDLAPRNVFVGAGDRVTLIDSLGRFRVPVHEDPAYLLVELLVGGFRVMRRGRPLTKTELARMRSEFLQGRGLVDDEVFAVFELRALLDMWRSLLQRSRAKTIRGRGYGATDAIRRRLVSGRVDAVMRRLGAS